MKVKAIISALMLMACGMASAQTKTYLNVETAPGVYKSFEVNKDLKISWGEKKEVPPTKGTAERTGSVNVRWVQLWENGPKFAEYNVGATSAPEYGDYYTWGGFENVVGVENPAYNSGLDDLSGTYDTATNLWGDNWRMPTKAEFEELLKSENCTCTWTENYNETGVNGLLCKGKEGTVYADNSVFLPAADGCYFGSVHGNGIYGYYWSSSPNNYNSAYRLTFRSGDQRVFEGDQHYGFSVRAVLVEE